MKNRNGGNTRFNKNRSCIEIFQAPLFLMSYVSLIRTEVVLKFCWSRSNHIRTVV